MAKNKPTAPAKSVSAAPAPYRKDGVRETVESVVIAFVLAFLFRTFEAEAFVIPTGSMAPTLMGVHKDLVCSECDFPFRVGASEEQDEDSKMAPAAREVKYVMCPNCRYEMNVDPQTPEGRQYPTYRGDRILVAKFPYDFADPQRWDVAVFKYPETASENYIKRVIGLPSETIVIRDGNIHTRGDDGGSLAIARKPPDKVRAIMQPVYDNDYRMPELIAAGLPLRWQAVGESDAGWQPLAGFRAYRSAGSAGGESWLGYQHRIPTQAQWRRFEQTGRFDAEAVGPIPPQLITDFYAYNTGLMRISPAREADFPGLHWVGDLILECELSPEAPLGGGPHELILRLVRGGRFFDCRIDLATGLATLSIPGRADAPSGQTGITAGSSHRVALANVDCQLLLWVDGSLVEFDLPTTYDDADRPVPTEDDLTPARIGARGVGLKVDHLRVLRDVYYIACRSHLPQGVAQFSISDYAGRVFPGLQEEDLAAYFADPRAWPRAFANLRTVEFPLRSDEFLMLGDNSPRSKDGRLWEGRDAQGNPEYFVKRDLLVGKALFVYWPHSWDRIPGTRIPFPYFPNFARMKFVR